MMGEKGEIFDGSLCIEISLIGGKKGKLFTNLYV